MGIEVKTALPHIQLDRLIENELPSEHRAQCQGILGITGREWIDFISYWPKLPLFVKRVHRDETYIAKLAAEVKAFNEEMLTIMETIQPTKAAA